MIDSTTVSLNYLQGIIQRFVAFTLRSGLSILKLFVSKIQ